MHAPILVAYPISGVKCHSGEYANVIEDLRLRPRMHGVYTIVPTFRLPRGVPVTAQEDVRPIRRVVPLTGFPRGFLEEVKAPGSRPGIAAAHRPAAPLPNSTDGSRTLSPATRLSTDKAIEGSHEQELSSRLEDVECGRHNSRSSVKFGLDSTPQVYAYTNRD
ncbi:hypothetical protein THAOC_21170 [Thalassiosira oceanica]|uniref:Uncharacterized protein n=1 Tax=Thalassiosira oceanica TaxID=159749 RepID=K0S095_THAOC|nr:hypothetical protein THAOC_21170 [Thalassiosira oceanica]|eukprot:EJK58685.1 hypothetical protein THAOC_21170 [Thalassiosira oceanica]